MEFFTAYWAVGAQYAGARQVFFDPLPPACNANILLRTGMERLRASLVSARWVGEWARGDVR